MKTFKKLIGLCLVLALALPTLIACSLVPPSDDPSASPAVTSPDPSAQNGSMLDSFTEAELDTAVIKIGDYSITLRDYVIAFQGAVDYYASYYNYDVLADATALSQMQTNMTDMLSKTQVILYHAHELGLDNFTQEQQAELDSRVEDYLTEMNDYFREQAEKEAETDSTIDVEKRVEELILEEASFYIGEGATYEEYLEYITKTERESYIGDLLKEEITKTATVTEDDISEWFTSQLEADKSKYTETHSQYKVDGDLLDIYGIETYAPITFVPEGYSRIYDISTVPTATLSEEYKTKLADMEQLSAEYGALAIEDAVNGNSANKKRMDEILDEYKELKDATDKERDELYKDAKDKIDEAYAKLESGEDFKTVMAEYTANANFINYDPIKENGMLISTESDAATDWSSTVKEQFKLLKQGEYSKVFLDDDGYHIIFYVKDETPGERTLEAMHDTIRDYLLPTVGEEMYNTQLNTWILDEALQVDNNLIARVGKNAS